ncbi:hypothetical protein NIES4102_33860 [Chondrocystis sp. NIES-4102]|nr:hypothetical protein NIES4102_33860 [Chondrocystis sp. NIES-4102]
MYKQEQSEKIVVAAYLQFFAQEVINLCDRDDCQQFDLATYEQIRQLWLELKQEKPEIVNYIQEK